MRTKNKTPTRAGQETSTWYSAYLTVTTKQDFLRLRLAYRKRMLHAAVAKYKAFQVMCRATESKQTIDKILKR